MALPVPLPGDVRRRPAGMNHSPELAVAQPSAPIVEGPGR